MKNSKEAHSHLPLTALLITLFAAETYISSGWKNFKLAQIINTSTPSRAAIIATNASSSPGLKDAIEQSQSCVGKSKEQAHGKGRQVIMSIWFSPYRRFPEVAPEGDQRGKGDYEYFTYLGKSTCGKIASNYGAFKGSPADQLFQRTSTQGLRAELLLATSLGYKLFALDARKVWLSRSDIADCDKYKAACMQTDDGFLVIRLHEAKGLIAKQGFLAYSKRMGDGATMAESLESISRNSFNKTYWYGWEMTSADSAMQWSRATNTKNSGVDIPVPLAGNSLPANLKVYLNANSSLGRLDLRLNCKDRKSTMITLATPKRKDITSVFGSCKPNQIFLIDALNSTGASRVFAAPQLSTSDQRRSFYGIEFRVENTLH